MPQVAPANDPTAGIPPIAQGDPNAMPTGPGTLSPEDSALLAAFGRGEISLGGPPATGAGPAAATGAGPSAVPQRQSVVPPIPEGFQPTLDPLAMENFVTRRQALGIPAGAAETAVQQLREGNMLYRNPQTGESRWLAMPGGAKDVGAQVAAGAEALKETATQPYKQVTIKRTNPQTGQPEELTMAGDDAYNYLHGVGAGAPGGPAGPPPGAAAPIAAPGMEDIAKSMGDMRDKSRIAQNGLDEAKQLQATLEQIGNVGPGTDWAGHISAILGRAGFSPDELSKAGLPNASDVFAAQKLSTDLLLNRAKESFNRVTNMDLGTVRGATPGTEMPLGASRDLLGNVVIPQLWRETRRYQDMAQNPAVWQSPAAFHQTYAAWDANNPIANFRTGPPSPGASQPAPAPGVAPAPGPAPSGAPAGPRRLRWDPTAGAAVPVGQ